MHPLPARLRSDFRALARAFVPEAEALDEAGWRRAEARAGKALHERPVTVRRQLGLFLLFLEATSLARHRRRLAHLDPVSLRGLLERIQYGRLVLLRRGLWGLRTLFLMGYYGLPDTRERIGYRAAAEGWRARARGGDR